MSELKIMTHLGPHLNIVNLLGACTKSGDCNKHSFYNKDTCTQVEMQNDCSHTAWIDRAAQLSVVEGF